MPALTSHGQTPPQPPERTLSQLAVSSLSPQLWRVQSWRYQLRCLPGPLHSSFWGADAEPQIPHGSGNYFPGSHQSCCRCGLRWRQCHPPRKPHVPGPEGYLGQKRLLGDLCSEGSAGQPGSGHLPQHTREGSCAWAETCHGHQSHQLAVCMPLWGQAVERAESGCRQDTKPQAAAFFHLSTSTVFP